MRSYLKVQSPWSQLSIFLLSLVGALVFTSSITLGIMGARGIHISGQEGISAADLSNPGLVNVLKWMQGFSSLGIFLLPAVFYAAVCFRYRPIWFLGFHQPEKRIFFGLALALALFALPFAGWLGELNEHIKLPASLMTYEKHADSELEAFMKTGSFSDVLLNLFIMALLPAICEEACFRGSLQRILIHLCKSPWVGILLTALLFSAFHMQFQGFLPRFFLGIVLGALYWYSGSLWVSILAHFMINGVQVIAAVYFPKMASENPSVPVFMALASGLIVIILLVKLSRESAMNYARVYEVDKVNERNEFIS